jgi:hypothetical protein
MVLSHIFNAIKNGECAKLDHLISTWKIILNWKELNTPLDYDLNHNKHHVRVRKMSMQQYGANLISMASMHHWTVLDKLNSDFLSNQAFIHNGNITLYEFV